MAYSFIYKDEVLGDIEVYESMRCKGLTFRMKNDGTLKLSKHPLFGYSDMMKSIVRMREKVLEMRERLEASGKKKQYLITPESPIKTREHELVMRAQSTAERVTCIKENKTYTIYYPETMDVEYEPLQKYARKCLGLICHNEAIHILPEKVMTWEKKLGVQHTKLDFRDMKSKWGSCSSTGRICLNVQLVRLPDELIDYVIVHELCHLKVMNHGAAFHDLVNTTLGGKEAQYRKELKILSQQMI